MQLKSQNASQEKKDGVTSGQQQKEESGAAYEQRGANTTTGANQRNPLMSVPIGYTPIGKRPNVSSSQGTNETLVQKNNSQATVNMEHPRTLSENQVNLRDKQIEQNAQNDSVISREPFKIEDGEQRKIFSKLQQSERRVVTAEDDMGIGFVGSPNTAVKKQSTLKQRTDRLSDGQFAATKDKGGLRQSYKE